jgi:hypothetical protein
MYTTEGRTEKFEQIQANGLLAYFFDFLPSRSKIMAGTVASRIIKLVSLRARCRRCCASLVVSEILIAINAGRDRYSRRISFCEYYFEALFFARIFRKMRNGGTRLAERDRRL